MKKPSIETSVGTFMFISIVCIGYLTVHLGEIDWMTKNRMNVFQFALDHNWECYSYWKDYRDVFPEMEKRGMTIGVGGHCLFMFMKEEKFPEHPEWFPLIKGKRQPRGQFCTRNEEAVRFYLNGLIEFLKQKRKK